MSGYIGSTPVPQATQHRESFTATEGQTSFATAGYTPQFVDVYLNGSHLSPADFTASNGSDVVLGVAASADDVCDIVSYTPFEIASPVFTGSATFNEGSADADFRVESNGNVNMLFVDGSANAVGIGVNDPDATLDISGGSNKLGILRVTQRAAGAAAYGLDVGLDSSTGDPVFSRIVNDTATEALRITRSSGLVTAANGLTLTDGNLTVAQGHGIDFSAQQATQAANASAAVETLSHYEQGTFTPVFINGGGVGIAAYAVQVGTYTRIGAMVHAQGRVVANGLGDFSSSVLLQGLPYDQVATTNAFTVVSIGKTEGLNITAGFSLTGSLAPNTTQMRLELNDATTGHTFFQVGELTADGGFAFSVQYHAV